MRGGKGMLKRVWTMFCTLMLMTCMLLISAEGVEASSKELILDGSYLTNEDESIGYDLKTTRGVDLLTGYSKCVRRGPGRIYAGGTTIATRSVESVQVGVMIERAQEGDTTWKVYDSWQKVNYNADRASSSRELVVEGGYYYRVRCLHSANDDTSSSFTDGIFIEKP